MWKKLFTVVSVSAVLTGCSLAPSNQPAGSPPSLNVLGDQQTQPVQQNSVVAAPVTTPTPGVKASALPSSKGGSVDQNEKITATQATIQTSKGEIVIDLYQTETPGTVENFLQKAKSGFYEGLTWHRVETWVIQGGDPKGNGTGGGDQPTELTDREFVIGSVGVARAGDINVSNDSQFFICTADCSWLTKQYTNFGTVTKGMDVAKKIAVGDKILGITYK